MEVLSLNSHHASVRWKSLSRSGSIEHSPTSIGQEHLQVKLRDEVRWTQQPNEDGVHLRKNGLSIFLPVKGQDAKGTVVMYHGFTAGPWQYKDMAQELHDKGYNVYAPRLPGHGLVDGQAKPWNRDIPEAKESARWGEFIDETIGDAQRLGVPVYAVGLSGGGGVALKAAERHPDVKGVAAMAPFIGGDGIVGALLPVLSVVDMVSFGLFGKLLNAIPLGKSQPSSDDDPTPRTAATLGQAVAMYRVGSSAKDVEQPLQLITTAKDAVSGVRKNKRLHDGGAGAERNGWYHFPAEAKVKHAMLSRLENTNLSSVEILEDVVEDYIISGAITDRLP